MESALGRRAEFFDGVCPWGSLFFDLHVFLGRTEILRGHGFLLTAKWFFDDVVFGFLTAPTVFVCPERVGGW